MPRTKESGTQYEQRIRDALTACRCANCKVEKANGMSALEMWSGEALVLIAENERLRVSLAKARLGLPDYAHPDLKAKQSDQIANVGALIDEALGGEDADPYSILEANPE